MTSDAVTYLCRNLKDKYLYQKRSTNELSRNLCSIYFRMSFRSDLERYINVMPNGIRDGDDNRDFIINFTPFESVGHDNADPGLTDITGVDIFKEVLTRDIHIDGMIFFRNYPEIS